MSKVIFVLLIALFNNAAQVNAQMLQLPSGTNSVVNGPSGRLSFINGPAYRFHIASNGLIGMNTGSPNTLLHVYGGDIRVKEVLNSPLNTDVNGADIYLEDAQGGFLDVFASNKEGVLECGGGTTVLKINPSTTAKVTIGNVTTPAGYRLYVKEGILTEKLKLAVSTDLVNWSDYVFEKDYKLLSLGEVERFIKKNKHLPDVPSAKDVYANGIDVSQMNATLLRKIEELTLYMIEMDKKNAALTQRVNQLESSNR